MPPGMCVSACWQAPSVLQPIFSLLPPGLPGMVAREYRPCLYHSRSRTSAMKSLTEAAARHYRKHGYYAPIPVLTRAEADALRARLETFEASGSGMRGAARHKPHLLFTWLNDLIRHERILDAVEDIVGP